MTSWVRIRIQTMINCNRGFQGTFRYSWKFKRSGGLRGPTRIGLGLPVEVDEGDGQSDAGQVEEETPAHSCPETCAITVVLTELRIHSCGLGRQASGSAYVSMEIRSISGLRIRNQFRIRIRIQGFMAINVKLLQLGKKNSYFKNQNCSLFITRPPWRTPKLQGKPSTLKRKT